MKPGDLKRWLAGRPLYPARRPLLISIEVTRRCNLRCRTCRAWQEKDPPPDLDLASFGRMLDNLAGLEGTPLDLIGAEPTLNPDLPAMVELAGRRGFPCRIFSNGLLLDEDLVAKLADAGLAQITLSLDGARAATHDRLRGVDGCFDQVWRAVELLQAALASRGGQVTLSTVISGLNHDELAEVAALARERGLDHCALHWVSRVPRDLLAGQGASGQYAAPDRDLLLSLEQAEELKARARRAWTQCRYDTLGLLAVLPLETYTRGRFPLHDCRFTGISLNVAQDGTVYPCSHWREPTWGNLLDASWTALWQGDARRGFRERLARGLPELCLYCCHHMHNLSLGQLIRCRLGRELSPVG